MTRENYIKYLQSMINDAEDMGLYDEDVESLQVAIKALEQKDWKFYYDHGYAQAKRDLKEPKTGHWEYTTHYGSRYRVCSECNIEREDDCSTGWNYCPNCGAKMESEET